MKQFLTLLGLSVILSCGTTGIPIQPQVPQENIPEVIMPLVENLARISDQVEKDRAAQEFLEDLTLPLKTEKGWIFVCYQKGTPPTVPTTLVGDFLPGTGDRPMTLVKNTGLNFTQVSNDPPDGSTYFFLIQGVTGPRRILDPFNPNISYAKPLRNIVRTPESPKSTIQVFPDVKPAGPNPKRDIYVYLPPEYQLNPQKRYPVFYMQDGQQLWDSKASANGGWKLDTAIDRLVAQGKMEPIIIVGVENTSKRTEEYVGYGAYFQAPEGLDTSKKAELVDLSVGYRDFLVKELKPFIDGKFRTLPDREHTAVGGSSFGAGISLWTGMTNTGVYSKVAALSGGNYNYDDETRMEKNFYQPYPFLIDQVLTKKLPLKIYLDCGGMDVDAIFQSRTRELSGALAEKGWVEGKDLMTVIDPSAGHNEIQWAKRVPAMLQYLFPAP